MNYNDLDTSKNFFEEGNKKFDLDNLQGALNEYSKSIEFNPNNVDAYFNRGTVRFELNHFNDAISDFSIVIYFSPKNDIALLKRGETYYELKDILLKIRYVPILLNLLRHQNSLHHL